MSLPNLQMDGACLITVERARQRHVEGYTAAHDDEEESLGQLLFAARAYVLHALMATQQKVFVPEPPPKWPWPRICWKPSEDPIRTLVKAGALIAAEIDRLQRLKAKDEGQAAIVQPAAPWPPCKMTLCPACGREEVLDGECQNCGVKVVPKTESEGK